MNEEPVVSEPNPHSPSPFQAIRAIDYTVIFVRPLAAESGPLISTREWLL
jgi:hypothetical protein